MDTARILKRQRKLLETHTSLQRFSTQDYLAIMAAYETATSTALLEALERANKEN